MLPIWDETRYTEFSLTLNDSRVHMDAFNLQPVDDPDLPRKPEAVALAGEHHEHDYPPP